jgi:hypothetical protein
MTPTDCNPTVKFMATDAATAEPERPERRAAPGEAPPPAPAPFVPGIASVARPDRSGRGSAASNSLTVDGLNALVSARRAARARP